MTQENRQYCSLSIASIALAAVMAVPMAFAQSTTTSEAPPQDASQTAQTTPAPATDASASTQSAEAAQSAPKQGWEDVDTDKDGTISKQEATVNPGLTQIFDMADTDNDGKLTPDEYKTFVSKNYSDQQSATPQQSTTP